MAHHQATSRRIRGNRVMPPPLRISHAPKPSASLRPHVIHHPAYESRASWLPLRADAWLCYSHHTRLSSCETGPTHCPTDSSGPLLDLRQVRIGTTGSGTFGVSKFLGSPSDLIQIQDGWPCHLRGESIIPISDSQHPQDILPSASWEEQSRDTASTREEDCRKRAELLRSPFLRETVTIHADLKTNLLLLEYFAAHSGSPSQGASRQPSGCDPHDASIGIAKAFSSWSSPA